MITISGRRGLSAGILLLLAVSAGGVRAQQPELSHVERFADARTRFKNAEAEATARLRAHPNDSKRLLDRGTARIHLGEFDAGLDDLGRAAAMDPSSAQAQTQLAYGLWMAGRLMEALAAAREAVKLEPNIASAQYYAGRLLLLTDGSTEEAIEHLQRAVLLNPDQTEIHFDLLTAYRKAGDAVRARAQLRLLRASLPPTNGLLLYAEGLIASDQGQADVALDSFRKAVAEQPGLISARQDLGVALAQAGRWQEAVEVLGPLTKEQPQSFPAAYFYALALQNSQHGEEAEGEIRRALTLDPGSADAYTLLGIVLASRGTYTDAVSALSRAAQLSPKNFDAQFYLGRARYALRDLAGAREAFLAAVELMPADVESRFFLATVLEEMGDRDGAQAQYLELTRLDPGDPRGFVGLGNFLAEHGEVEGAMTALRHARELDPQNFEATLALGRLLAHQEQWKPAIALLREATERTPQSAEAHYQLGLALRRNGQLQEAQKEFAIVDRLNREYRKGAGGMGNPRGTNPERP